MRYISTRRNDVLEAAVDAYMAFSDKLCDETAAAAAASADAADATAARLAPTFAAAVEARDALGAAIASDQDMTTLSPLAAAAAAAFAAAAAAEPEVAAAKAAAAAAAAAEQADRDTAKVRFDQALRCCKRKRSAAINDGFGDSEAETDEDEDQHIDQHTPRLRSLAEAITQLCTRHVEGFVAAGEKVMGISSAAAPPAAAAAAVTAAAAARKLDLRLNPALWVSRPNVCLPTLFSNSTADNDCAYVYKRLRRHQATAAWPPFTHHNIHACFKS